MAHRRRETGSRFAGSTGGRQSGGRAARLLLLVVAGGAVGTAAGIQVAAVIERAGFAAPSQVAAPVPLAAAGEKPGENDRAMGGTLAAAMRADEPTDCLTLAPRHRSGCRDYVADLARQPALTTTPVDTHINGTGEANSSTDWPAALD